MGENDLKRRRTRTVTIGDVPVGGDAPISVQSMTNTKTTDVGATLDQLVGLERAGCEIARVAVPDSKAASALADIVASSPLPIVADIHFDYKLGLKSVDAGAHALRFNPGNIGGADRVRELAAASAERGIPIRIGVNAGSLEKDILAEHGGPTADGMVKSVSRHVELLEKAGFSDIILSLKSSDVPTTIRANQIMASRCDYPFHIGVTEAGAPLTGTIRSAIGIGALLASGIGDTVRVSLAGPPEREVVVARRILAALGLRPGGVTVIACPTCGRTELDVQGIAERIEHETAGVRAALVVAVMGCAVNGPGEAREADVGVAGGGEDAVLFKLGVPVERIRGGDIADRLLAEIRALAEE